MELELEQGKVAEAEQIILRARDAARIAGPDPSLLLGPLYYRQGRVEEAMRSVEATWRAHSKSGGPASRTAIDQLRLYIQYRSSPIPYEVVRATLELAGRIAPDDDRIWLWKGTLAIAAGDYDEASRWLDRCQKMHAEDPAVWDARLDWAMATDHVLVAREALKHLPATEFSPAQVARVTAWFARERGDNESERRSLERLIALEPTDDAAFDRLIECSTKNGQPEVAVELGRRKADIGKLQARYRKLYARRQPRRDAAEMGRLAKQLGYRFEAEAFLAIAIALDLPDVRRDGTPLARSVQAPVGPARTAYDVLAPELNVVRQTGPTQPLKSDRALAAAPLAAMRLSSWGAELGGPMRFYWRPSSSSTPSFYQTCQPYRTFWAAPALPAVPPRHHRHSLNIRPEKRPPHSPTQFASSRNLPLNQIIT